MSEEEKIVDRVSMIDQWKTSGDVYTQDELNAIGGLLDLYYKQQKEIEELEAKNKQYQGIEEGTTIIYKSKAKYVREDRIEKYYINKNKIREKMKEVKELSTAGYEILKELLEEQT